MSFIPVKAGILFIIFIEYKYNIKVHLIMRNIHQENYTKEGEI